jgi:hypothetical protein
MLQTYLTAGQEKKGARWIHVWNRIDKVDLPSNPFLENYI